MLCRNCTTVPDVICKFCVRSYTNTKTVEARGSKLICLPWTKSGSFTAQQWVVSGLRPIEQNTISSALHSFDCKCQLGGEMLCLYKSSPSKCTFAMKTCIDENKPYNKNANPVECTSLDKNTGSDINPPFDEVNYSISTACVPIVETIIKEIENGNDHRLDEYWSSQCNDEGKTYQIGDLYTSGTIKMNTDVCCTCIWNASYCKVGRKSFDNINFNLRCVNCTKSEAIYQFYPKG